MSQIDIHREPSTQWTQQPNGDFLLGDSNDGAGVYQVNGVWCCNVIANGVIVEMDTPLMVGTEEGAKRDAEILMGKHGVRIQGPVTNMDGPCVWEGVEKSRHELYTDGAYTHCRRCGIRTKENLAE